MVTLVRIGHGGRGGVTHKGGAMGKGIGGWGANTAFVCAAPRIVSRRGDGALGYRHQDGTAGPLSSHTATARHLQRKKSLVRTNLVSSIGKRERQEHQRRAGSSSRRGGRPLGHVTGTGPRVPCHDARAASSRHERRRAWPTRRTLSGAACVVGGAGEWARKRAGNVWRANFQGDKSIETQPMTARAKFSRSFAVRGWGWASIDAGFHAEGRVLVLWGGPAPVVV